MMVIMDIRSIIEPVSKWGIILFIFIAASIFTCSLLSGIFTIILRSSSLGVLFAMSYLFCIGFALCLPFLKNRRVLFIFFTSYYGILSFITIFSGVVISFIISVKPHVEGGLKSLRKPILLLTALVMLIYCISLTGKTSYNRAWPINDSYLQGDNFRYFSGVEGFPGNRLVYLYDAKSRGFLLKIKCFDGSGIGFLKDTFFYKAKFKSHGSWEVGCFSIKGQKIKGKWNSKPGSFISTHIVEFRNALLIGESNLISMTRYLWDFENNRFSIIKNPYGQEDFPFEPMRRDERGNLFYFIFTHGVKTTCYSIDLQNMITTPVTDLPSVMKIRMVIDNNWFFFKDKKNSENVIFQKEYGLIYLQTSNLTNPVTVIGKSILYTKRTRDGLFRLNLYNLHSKRTTVFNLDPGYYTWRNGFLIKEEKIGIYASKTTLLTLNEKGEIKKGISFSMPSTGFIPLKFSSDFLLVRGRQDSFDRSFIVSLKDGTKRYL